MFKGFVAYVSVLIVLFSHFYICGCKNLLPVPCCLSQDELAWTADPGPDVIHLCLVLAILSFNQRRFS